MQALDQGAGVGGAASLPPSTSAAKKLLDLEDEDEMLDYEVDEEEEDALESEDASETDPSYSSLILMTSSSSPSGSRSGNDWTKLSASLIYSRLLSADGSLLQCRL